MTLFQKFVKILCTDFPTVKFLPRNPNQAFHEPKPNLNKHLVRLKVGGEKTFFNNGNELPADQARCLLTLNTSSLRCFSDVYFQLTGQLKNK